MTWIGTSERGGVGFFCRSSGRHPNFLRLYGTKQTVKQTVTTGHESIAHLILHRESETSSWRVQVPGLSEATAPEATMHREGMLYREENAVLLVPSASFFAQ